MSEENLPISADKFVEAIKNTIAVTDALAAIKQRSYSGRNPQLGKMIKCQVCKTRHRENERKCVQVFATGRYDLREPKPLLIAGQTPETAPDITVEAEIGRKNVRIAVGSAVFNGKRKNPHVSRRKLQFVNVVHLLIEDGWTQEELVKARKIATQILVKRWGRYHFLESLADKAKRLRTANV
jgi:hypothetical protein